MSWKAITYSRPLAHAGSRKTARSSLASGIRYPKTESSGSTATPTPPRPYLRHLPSSFPESEAAVLRRRMTAVAPAPQNGHAHTNGMAAGDAVILALEEGQHRKKPGGDAAPVRQNGISKANGLPNGVAVVGEPVIMSTEEGRRQNLAGQHNMMLGTHHFGERTHAGVQQRHYKAVKWVGARLPIAEAQPQSSASVASMCLAIRCAACQHWQS